MQSYIIKCSEQTICFEIATAYFQITGSP